MRVGIRAVVLTGTLLAGPRQLDLWAAASADQEPGTKATAPPTDAQMKKLAADLDNVSLLKAASGFRAVAQFKEWGPAARAATPYVLPLLQHKKPEVRVNALMVLAKINPEEALPQLRTLALKDPESTVRSAAVEEIQDENVLAELVRAAPRDAREAAAVSLSKSTVLQEIALHDANPEVRADAIFALADAAVVADIAKNDAEPLARRAAELRATADAARDIHLQKVGCDLVDSDAGSRIRFKSVAHDVVCTLQVGNSGQVAYESTTWEFVAGANGEGSAPDRIEPGETKKLYMFATTPSTGKKTYQAVLRSAVARRPATLVK